MSTAQNKLLAQRIGEEIFNQGNLNMVDELLAADAIDHNEPEGTDCRAHFKQVATMLRSAAPDLHMHVENLVAEDDRVAVHITISGTHSGPGALFGVPPTGKHFQIQQMRFARIVDGQMKDSWAVIDMLAWMQQLGAIPARGRGEALLRGQ